MQIDPNDYDPADLRRMAEEQMPGGNSGNGNQKRQSRDGEASAANAGRQAAHNGDSQAFRFGGAQEAARNQSQTSNPNPAPSPTPGPSMGRPQSRLEQLFMHQSAMSADAMEKPYLASLPQQYAAERVIFDWLEYLVTTGGFKRTMEALRYYRTIDWITETVESDLQDYLVGFATDEEQTTELGVEEHQTSLVYLARLASMC